MSHASKSALAKASGLTRSSLYYRPSLPARDWQTKIRLEEALHGHPSYGHKRLALLLGLGKHRVLRVMKRFGIKPYRRRAKKPWKKAGGEAVSYPNLLLKVFPSEPNQIWVSDFTYLNFKGKFVYLATVMDIFNREIVGFSVMTGHSVNLVSNALLSAITFRPPPSILHSDQGREYTSKIYLQLVVALGTRISLSRKASPWENGYQESFYSQFKIDLGDPNRFANLGELIAELYQVIYTYNQSRIHSALKMSPRQYLNRYLAMHKLS